MKRAFNYSLRRAKVRLPALLVVIGVLLQAGCQSAFGPQIGMTEKQWLRRTLVADVAYMEGSVKAYRSGGAYYYFRNGVLVTVDQGMVPAHKVEMEVHSEQTLVQTTDVYDELRKLDALRKDGIITAEEFQTWKEELLNQ